MFSIAENTSVGKHTNKCQKMDLRDSSLPSGQDFDIE